MRAIETTVTVTNKGTLSGRVPGRLRPGKHRAVIVLDDGEVGRCDVAPLPDLTRFRERLGCTAYPGNSVVDYREDERT
jgi:hypothetical protein